MDILFLFLISSFQEIVKEMCNVLESKTAISTIKYFMKLSILGHKSFYTLQSTAVGLATPEVSSQPEDILLIGWQNYIFKEEWNLWWCFIKTEHMV